MADDSEQILLIVLCIFIPPLAVYWKSKLCDVYVLIALLLMLLFWLPGIFFACWYCFMRNN